MSTVRTAAITISITITALSIAPAIFVTIYSAMPSNITKAASVHRL